MIAISDAVWALYRWGLRLLVPKHPVSLAIRAEEALGQQHWGRAFDLSHGALRQRDDFAPAFFVRGIARLHLDDYGGALHDLSRFLALVEEPPPVAYYWRGWIYAQKQEWALALADFDRVLAVTPKDPHLHYWRAYVFWQRGEWEPMREALAQFEALAPGTPLAWELRGHLLLHDGAFAAAVGAYTRAIEGGWETPDLRYNRAVARRQLGHHDEARADIEAIIGMDPHNAWAHLELSNFAFASGKYDEALRHARSAVAFDPDGYEVRLSEAAVLMAMGESHDARACLARMRRDFEGEPLVEQLYGDLLAEANENEAAAASYRAVLQKEPGNHLVRVKLVGELIALEQYDEAEAELATVLLARPDCTEAHEARADLYRYTDRPAAMRAELDWLIERDPEHAWALVFRAAHRQWERDVAGALEDYAVALATDTSEGWMWAFRGQLLLRLGHLEAAREDFQCAITLDPEDPWIRRQWAEWLLRGGNMERATQVLDCLVEDQPADGFARLLRAELHLLAAEWDAAADHLQRLVSDGHELAWLAHVALAVLDEGARAEHLALADALRPSPSFWGVTPATVGAQRALVAWLRGEAIASEIILCDALAHLELGEWPWLALRPLLTQLGAVPLLACLDGWAARTVPAPLAVTLPVGRA